MSDWLLAIAAWLAGIGLGIFFYAGLWLTVNKAMTARHPGIWFALSLVARSAVVLAGLYFVSGRQWPRLLLAVAGFILARIVLTRRVKKTLSTEQSRQDNGMSGGETHGPHT
jgi:F1F0 ATPase subunit 2